jgi:hypothetical protein
MLSDDKKIFRGLRSNIWWDGEKGGDGWRLEREKGAGKKERDAEAERGQGGGWSLGGRVWLRIG